MSQYTTKNTMYWMTGIIIGAVISAVSGGYSMTAAQVEKVIKLNNDTVEAFNDGQNSQIESHRRRLDKVETEQQNIREVISNFKIENASNMGEIKGILNQILNEAKKK